MRRRPPPEDDRDPTPRELRHFRPDDWPGDDLAAAGRWWAAREDYAARTGMRPTLDDDSPLPDTPFRTDDI